MSDNAIEALRGELGDAHVNRLHEKKRGLNSTVTVREAVVDRQLLEQLLRQSGVPIDPDAKGQLQVAVEDAINADQESKNRKLTRDETRTITQGILDRRVMVDTWGPDQARIVAAIIDPSDRDTAYVPMAQIPAEVVTRYLNYARSLSPTLGAMPESELRARFTSRIQRAYGLRLLGGTQAEVEAAMKGTR